MQITLIWLKNFEKVRKNHSMRKQKYRCGLNKEWSLSDERNNVEEMDDLGRCFGVNGILEKANGTKFGVYARQIASLSNGNNSCG